MSDHQPADHLYNFHDPFTTYQYNLLGQAAAAAESNSFNNGMNGMSFSESLDGSSMIDYNTLARAFGLSSSSSEELFSSVAGLGYGKEQVTGEKMVQGVVDDQGACSERICGGEVLLASPGPHSSISSSSGEASGGEEDCSKKEHKVAKGSNEDEDGHISQKQNKQSNKKGEKREREPRVAFMTKSEVDHLEDGYRWRKYGQKAVKNSPYPRSYYRCTTQKCNVKKRVERSFQDPSIVITTYEGQHNHPIPTTLRGSYNASGLMLSSASSLSPAAFNVGGVRQGASNFINPPGGLLFRMPHQYNNNLVQGSTMGYNTSVHPSMPLTSLPQQLQQRRQQQQVQADYGMLQDMINTTASLGDPKQEQP
ncbi:unnamed protein product [Rhodiola kirilowii]